MTNATSTLPEIYVLLLALQGEINTDPQQSLLSSGHSSTVTLLRPYICPGFSHLNVDVSLVDRDSSSRG